MPALSAVAMILPSALAATQDKALPDIDERGRGVASAPVRGPARFHSITVASKLPLASVRPSGLTATDVTVLVCPGNAAI